MKKQHKKIIIEQICKNCIEGTCCKGGVDVDLEEAKKISRLKIPVKKPWFTGLHEDKYLPSGWALETVVRNGRCVFQNKNKKCTIYKHRPLYCREFPYEKGKINKDVEYFCRKGKTIKSL